MSVVACKPSGRRPIRWKQSSSFEKRSRVEGFQKSSLRSNLHQCKVKVSPNDVTTEPEKDGKPILLPTNSGSSKQMLYPDEIMMDKDVIHNPGSASDLASENFDREFGGMFGYFKELFGGDGEGSAAMRTPERYMFRLDNELVEALDLKYPAPGPQQAPRAVMALYGILVFVIDKLYEGKAIQRFWCLETVARVPYFAYQSVLHTYETLGWWRVPELRRMHADEEWNELHHLLIMEALGGGKSWWDRFLAQHAAVFYYFALLAFYMISPQWSYKFSEMVENHARNTYTVFLEQNANRLKIMPSPRIAAAYYSNGLIYRYTDLTTTGTEHVTHDRPPCENLFDVFINIRNDEQEHVKTMIACQEYTSGMLDETIDYDKSMELCDTECEEMTSPLDPLYLNDAYGHGDDKETRSSWNNWAESVNNMPKEK